MERNFHRVTQSLRSDHGLRSTTGVLVGFLLLGTWIAWSLEARVSRYEISDNARLEVNGAVYPIQADLSGQVASTALVIGKEIHAGDVLVTLDATKERLSLQEEQARLASLRPQLAVLRSQLSTQAEGRVDEREVLHWSEEEAQAKFQEADAQARLAEQEARRAELLRKSGIIAEAEAQRAEASAQRYRAAAESLKVSLGSLRPQLQVREADREAHVKEVYGEMAKLEADETTSSATIQRLEYETQRRTIRASKDGKLIECAELHPGQHVGEGDKLGVITSKGRVQMVAQFLPAAAFGKLHPGQTAVVKLNGFPWAQYGTVPAVVSRVAGEVRDGTVRVELAVNPSHLSRVPLQHGAPGSVEVQVERVSPAALLLSSAGRLIGAH
ncbi:MAG TPA: HlyD family efflux transporter periplasmic adaptor subunit [Bryobacteraceae bacterium]|nr:HlyD family efflux transporter periplasmic adaptor subunit [Bryobacteraceae bacterium]